MRTTGAEALQPVLKFLDWLIAEHGHLLYMGLVYVSIPFIAWILSGGLRRRLSPDSATGIAIIVIRPAALPPPQPPPRIGRERDSFDGDSFAA